MKRTLIVLFTFLTLVGCNTKKKEIERLQTKNDSLMQVAQLNEESLYDYISSFNEIQRNLDSIKALENIINVRTAGGEVKSSTKEQINEDIKIIYELLAKNKKLVASLQKKLSSSDVRMAELEKMVTYLNTQVEEKDAHINTLRGELEKMNIQLANLSSQVAELEEVTQQKEEEIQKHKEEIEIKTSLLNMAYYAIGTKKELSDNNIITKEGGFLGIGSTKTLKEDFNKDYFTKVDITRLEYIPLGTKKAKLITKHPATAYRISGEKRADTLFITNPSEFWAAGKYLVIEVE
ncbi:MAG: Uncharacterized protein XD81_1266 [Bacteroidetes bacterium 38_7]|nr:MAG: Uncharacterized protein XD81_1266 [Bacteroidetes bacterium 38_7]